MWNLGLVLALLGACGDSTNHGPPKDAAHADSPAADAGAGADATSMSMFGARIDFATGGSPTSVAIVDLNGDGKPDLAVADTNSTTVSVLLNTTTGPTPSFAAKVDFQSGLAPASVAVGDLNGDGKPDLAVANVGANTVSILFDTTATGAPTPTFAPAVEFDTGLSPEFVAIGDFNGDGKPDLAVANFGSSTVSIFLDTTTAGATTPTFAARVDFPTGAGPVSVVAVDLDGDGKPDLAVLDLTANTISLLLDTTSTNATIPTFRTKIDVATGSQPNGSVAIGDLNGDGKPDLAVSDQGSNTISVFLDTTTVGALAPTVAPKVDFPTGATPAFVAIADLDGDGNPDLAVTNDGANTVAVLVNTTAAGASTPSLATHVDFATGSMPRCVAIGDLNGDGKPDLVVGNSQSNTVSVLAAQ